VTLHNKSLNLFEFILDSGSSFARGGFESTTGDLDKILSHLLSYKIIQSEKYEYKFTDMGHDFYLRASFDNLKNVDVQG
jgi:hypothetical protein